MDQWWHYISILCLFQIWDFLHLRVSALNFTTILVLPAPVSENIKKKNIMLALKYAVSHSSFINIQMNKIFKREKKRKIWKYKKSALLTHVYFHGSFQHPPGSFGLVQSSGRAHQTSSHRWSTHSSQYSGRYFYSSKIASCVKNKNKTWV